MNDYDLAQWQKKLESDVQQAKRDQKTSVKLQILQLILVTLFAAWSISHHAQDDDRIEKDIRRLGHSLTSAEEVLKILNAH
jgi:hypothetical protein